jgi:hypothetical protein
MSPRQARKEQLERMPRDAIIAAWVQATANKESGLRSVPQLIDEILRKEYPAHDEPVRE